MEDSGLFLFVGISFSLLTSFAGGILCSLVCSWWAGTVVNISEVPGKRSPEKDFLKCQPHWGGASECGAPAGTWESPQI